jgi:CheY-like chemotaxis protein
MAYRGLVPMSPYTTPSAARDNALIPAAACVCSDIDGTVPMLECEGTGSARALLMLLSCAPSYVRVVHVLVVEDDLKMAGLLRRGLEHEGYAVDVVGTGSEALWAAEELTIDAVVLDEMIPSPDGFEVCRQLRRAGRWMPVLLLTARDSVSDRVARSRRGLDGHAPSPPAAPRATSEHALGADPATRRQDRRRT